MLPVFIVDDTITFTLNQLNGKGNAVNFSIESLMTKYGMFIPLNDQILTIPKWIEYGDRYISCPYRRLIGVLITHQGTVERISFERLVGDDDEEENRTYRKKDRVMLKNLSISNYRLRSMILPYGKGIKNAIDEQDSREGYAILSMNIGKTIPEMVGAYMKTCPVKRVEYFTYSIPEIVEVLNNTTTPEPWPFSWDIGQVKETKKDKDLIDDIKATVARAIGEDQ